jgi:hypothetical protein
VVIVLAAVIFPRLSGGGGGGGDITGEITDARVLAADYHQSSSGNVAIKLPADWDFRQISDNDVWITNNSWFYDHGVLNTNVEGGRLSMRTVGAAVEDGNFSREDLRSVSLGTINQVFQSAGIDRQFRDGDLAQGTINGYDAVWVRGQLEDSDYYLAFYYVEDKRWLQGVIVNAGRGDLDRNQQLVSDLVRSIQVTV